jgi:hypothetical protein
MCAKETANPLGELNAGGWPRSARLASVAGLALILLVAWTGLLYSKVLRLSGKDEVHGLRVAR